MVARLGNPPVHVATAGVYASEFFTRDGMLQQPLHPNQRVSLDRVLVERYGLAAEDVSGTGLAGGICSEISWPRLHC